MVQRIRWLRVGLYALAGIFAVLVILVSLLVTVDFGMFKGRIETFVTDLLQRELRIDGTFHADLGMSIDVYAEDVFFANPGWADEPAFVSARKIDVSVDTWSLFNWPIRFNRAEIQGVDVNIRFSGDGRASWTFDKFAKDEEPARPRVRRDFPIMWNNVKSFT